MGEEPAIYGTGEPGRDPAEIVAELEHDMRLAAQELRFEEAAEIRDRIRALQGEPPEPAKGRSRSGPGRRKRPSSAGPKRPKS